MPSDHFRTSSNSRTPGPSARCKQLRRPKNGKVPIGIHPPIHPSIHPFHLHIEAARASQQDKTKPKPLVSCDYQARQARFAPSRPRRLRTKGTASDCFDQSQRGKALQPMLWPVLLPCRGVPFASTLLGLTAIASCGTFRTYTQPSVPQPILKFCRVCISFHTPTISRPFCLHGIFTFKMVLRVDFSSL